MFINPKKGIEEGWIKNVNEKNIQPNAIDITADEVWKVAQHDADITSKRHRNRNTISTNERGYWNLFQGVYDFASETYIEVPEGVVGWLHTRSTLNRNGIMVHSGLYDSGFKGPICGMLYNHVAGNVYMTPGTCVAQFIMAESKSEGLYSGGYNVEEGSTWFENKK
tara:strand:+ start:1417 stop:1914 length:498 start_codon:yes stop_codon:yes gene_type:complete